MTIYRVVAYFEVEGPPQHARAAEKFIHALVQGDVGLDTQTTTGWLNLTGARAERVEVLEP